MAGNSAAALMRQQFKDGRGWLLGTVGDLTSEQAHHEVDGKALPIAAQYAHVVTAEDFFIHGLVRGTTPLMVGEFAQKSGLSSPPPPGTAWAEWGRTVKVDLPALGAYAQAVFAATDAYLATVTDDELARMVDMSQFGFGSNSVAWVLTIIQHNMLAHAGEISALKGLQGLKGYPF